MTHFARLACLLGLLTSSAYAMLPPKYYQQARENAPYHVQVAVTRAVAPPSGPGGCRVDGRVVEIFKGAAAKLSAGMPISFSIACHRPGDEVLIGGTLWTDVAALEKAKYIEVYLDDAGDGFDVAMWQSRIIDAPSAAAQLPVD